MSRLSKSLFAGATFTLLTPAAIGMAMLWQPAEAAADQPQAMPVAVVVAPVKPMRIETLGRANAVAWISRGHLSAVP